RAGTGPGRRGGGSVTRWRVLGGGKTLLVPATAGYDTTPPADNPQRTRAARPEESNDALPTASLRQPAPVRRPGPGRRGVEGRRREGAHHAGQADVDVGLRQPDQAGRGHPAR